MNMIYEDSRKNRIYGETPIFRESTINFGGNHNIFYCEEGVVLDKATLNFYGDHNILYCKKDVVLNKSVLNFLRNNSLVYLGTGEHKMNADLFHESVLHVGKTCMYSDTARFIMSEHKHCFIGDDCLISYNFLLRNADAHLIYSCDTKERMNCSNSIYIGDHVWIGQNVTVLKNTQIDSGSIIGIGSVVAGKKIMHNSTWGGYRAG